MGIQVQTQWNEKVYRNKLPIDNKKPMVMQLAQPINLCW